MTKQQRIIIARLHEADAELRKAMVIAGGLKMILVTDAIRESEWYLDEAIAHCSRWKEVKVKKVKKVVDK